MATKNTVEIIIAAVDKTREAVANARQSLGALTASAAKVNSELANIGKAAEKGFAPLITAASTLNNVLAAVGAGFTFQSLIGAADAITMLKNRLELATGSTEKAGSAYKGLFEIAQRSRVGFTELGTTFAKLTSATNGAGISQQRLLKVTEAVANAIAISGSSAQSTQAAMLQFGQGMASGVLRGEELNSILEQTPELAYAIADGMGIARGALRKYGEQGLLTTKAVINALEKQAEILAARMAGTNATISQSFTLVKNSYENLVGQADAATGATKKIAAALLSISDAMDKLSENPEELKRNLQLIGDILLAVFGGKATTAILSLVGNVAKLKSMFAGLMPVVAIFTAIRWFETSKNVANLDGEVKRLTDSFKKGAAETELLVRAANELNGQGALSLKTQLDLAALAAQKMRDNLPAVATALTDVGKTASAAGDQIKAALQDEVKRAATTVKALSDAYKQANADIGASLKERLASIDKSYKQQADSAKQAAQSEAQQIAGTTQALINAEAQKIAAIFNAATDMQAAWQQTYSAAIALATQAGEAEIQAARDAGIGIEQAQRDTAAKIAQIDREFAQQKLSAYEQIASAYRGTVDRLIAEEQRHLQAARSAEEARLNLKLSVEDRIRSLLQKGMDDQTAHADRQKQIDEKQSAARQALAQGDYEKARKLSEESLALIERNATEVTKTVTENGKTTTEVVLSQGRASVQAMGEMRESADIADQALLKLGDSHKQAGAAAGQGANAAKSALEGVTAEIATLREALAQQGQMVISVNTDAAKKGVDDIQAYLNAAALVAQIALDTATAQASVKALQADLDNLSLVAKVEADTSKVLTDIAALKNITADARLVIPAAADFSAAENTLRQFAADAKTTLSQPTAHTHTVRANTASAEAAIDRLERNTYSTHTIRVKKVEENALGGLVGAAQRFAAGGQAWADHAASAYRRMSGRISGPGTDTSDNIPALLSPGEYVNRASSVRRFGVAFFDALNAGQLPAALMPQAAFAGGGPVLAGLADTGPGTGARDQVDITLRVGAQALPLQSSRATAMQLATALRQLSRAA